MKIHCILFLNLLLVTTLYCQILTVAPSNGATIGGSSITISGNPSFGSLTSYSVLFGSASANCTTFGVSLNCNAPPGTGTVAVTVFISGTEYGGTANYTYQDITGISMTPLTGPTMGGTTVTITSNNDFICATIACYVGGQPGSASCTSASTMTCVTPAGTQGNASITVSDNSGIDTFPQSTPINYFYNDITVSGVSPSSGPTAGGTSVTVTGTGFSNGYGGPDCMFGSNAVQAAISSSTSATCTSPSGSVGSASVTFSNDGVNYYPATNGPTFTYNDAFKSIQYSGALIITSLISILFL